MTTATADWQEVLAKRTNERLKGRCRPSGKGKNALLDAISVQTPALDVPARCATFTVSTSTPDRSQDVVHPEGCLYDNFKNNPIAYFDHGFSGIQSPIGKWQDPDGNCTLSVKDDGIEATLYFADTYEAGQIWSLVEQGVLKCASINMTPTAATVRTTEDTGRGRPGLDITEWELLEISVVGIPDNPEALRKAIAGGGITSKPLLKSLTKGGTPGEGGALSHKSETGTGTPPNGQIQMSNEKKPDDERAATADDDSEDRDDPEDDDDDVMNKPSSKCLHKCYKSLKKHLNATMKALVPLENEPVTKGLEEHCLNCKGELEGLNALHHKAHGTDIKDADGDEDAGDESEMKSLALDARTPRQLRGLLGTLKDLARVKDCPPKLRAAIFSVANRGSRMIDEAIEKAAQSQETDELASLKKQIAETTQKIKALAPANAA